MSTRCLAAGRCIRADAARHRKRRSWRQSRLAWLVPLRAGDFGIQAAGIHCRLVPTELLDAHQATRAQVIRDLGRGEHTLNCRAETVRIQRIDHDAGTAYHLRQRRAVRADHWRAAGQRLEWGQAEALVERGEGEASRRAVDGWQILLGDRQTHHLLRDAEGSRQRPPVWEQRAGAEPAHIAGDDELEIALAELMVDGGEGADEARAV